MSRSKRDKVTRNSFSLDQCDSYSKNALIDLARELGVSVGGNKDALCQKIHKALREENRSPRSKNGKRSRGSGDSQEESGNSSSRGSGGSRSSNKKKRSEAASKSDDEEFNMAQCKKYSVAKLKELCKQNNLKVSGTKAELCERLSSKFTCNFPEAESKDFNEAENKVEFNVKKCEGANPKYSKAELESFAEKNNMKISRGDTKRKICDKLLEKLECKDGKEQEPLKSPQEDETQGERMVYDKEKCRGNKPIYSKAELLQLAEQYSIKIRKNATKEELCTTIRREMRARRKAEKDESDDSQQPQTPPPQKPQTPQTPPPQKQPCNTSGDGKDIKCGKADEICDISLGSCVNEYEAEFSDKQGAMLNGIRVIGSTEALDILKKTLNKDPLQAPQKIKRKPARPIPQQPPKQDAKEREEKEPSSRSTRVTEGTEIYEQRVPRGDKGIRDISTYKVLMKRRPQGPDQRAEGYQDVALGGARRKEEEARKKLQDILKKRQEEENINELPDKDSLLASARKVTEIQKEIAQCLGLN